MVGSCGGNSNYFWGCYLGYKKMKDFSSNLPSWAIHEGYQLLGGAGTFDELYLYKGFRLVKAWTCLEEIPNLFELEEMVSGIENEC